MASEETIFTVKTERDLLKRKLHASKSNAAKYRSKAAFLDARSASLEAELDALDRWIKLRAGVQSELLSLPENPAPVPIQPSVNGVLNTFASCTDPKRRRSLRGLEPYTV